MDSTSNVRGGALIAATVSGAGNTLATAPCCANVKIASFTGPGTFIVFQLEHGPLAIVDYMVVAGGGGGGGASSFCEVVVEQVDLENLQEQLLDVIQLSPLGSGVAGLPVFHLDLIQLQ